MNWDILAYIGIPFLSLSFAVIWAYVYIKIKYREYDENETKKEQIQFLKTKILGADNYFYKTYSSDFDSTVYRNIKIKIDFLTNLISHKSLDEQIKYYKILFERLYETGVRLKTKFDDVTYIIAPLNDLYNELFKAQLDFLKEMTKEESV